MLTLESLRTPNKPSSSRRPGINVVRNIRDGQPILALDIRLGDIDEGRSVSKSPLIFQHLEQVY